ncbi:MAG: hypothetical protein ACKVHR_10940 [Pirellulales bacterium]
MDHMIYKRIEPVIRRTRFLRVAWTLASIWGLSLVVAVVMIYLNRTGELDVSKVGFPFLIATFALSAIGLCVELFKSDSSIKTVKRIEREFPELDSSLLTAIEQQAEDGKSLSFLQQAVMRKAVTHSYEHSWASLVPRWQLIMAPLVGLFSLCGWMIAMVCLVWFAIGQEGDTAIAFSDLAINAGQLTIAVEPGNAEVERGTSLLVLARFGDSLPTNANLMYVNQDGEEVCVSMSKSLDDPVFGARIPTVQAPLSYRVEYADQSTEAYEVTVFDYPRLVRADATLKYPQYTGSEDKVLQDFRRLTAVEGTTAQFEFYLNKPVSSAVLFPKDDGEPIDLVLDTEDPRRLLLTLELAESQKYELELTDVDQRGNRTPPKFVLNVLENRPPDLKLLTPARDIDASPIEEVQLSASAWDDFGIESFGVNFEIPGRPAQEVELEQIAAGNKRKKVEYLLDLESLDVQPDDLVSYYFWAEDIGSNGERRQVASDMFFAEVRHFEEIFRQGQAQTASEQQQQQQQQQQQGGQNAEQAQELAELQKEIINATWKVIRREDSRGSRKSGLSETFVSDTELLSQSQATAIESLMELASELEDEESLAFVEPARDFMTEAVLKLERAKEKSDLESLKSALSSEQAAYQGLLKLRAREFEVTQQQQQPQQPGQPQQQNNRQQDQLDQLNLKEDENRYENEKTAQEQTEQSQQQQEDRQVLSRLRELSQRQEDLNERIKELQSALEEADSQEEKEEVERRLKSLREQQEQMLRDAEELLDRMQSEENQQRMAEDAEQLEEVRENLQRAAEALEDNEISRAAAEGTRAQRELEELRDELQNQSSGQFTEQMKELRQEAQEIEQKQEDIAEQMAESDLPGAQEDSRSLRETESEQPDLDRQLAEQEQAVEALRDRMRRTIEEAEPFEPLLAEELYDTYRDSEVSRPDKALESARESFNRGWKEDAISEEQRAREGIQEIREGIENAAESVLGDETEALKAARDTLERLNRDLQDEIQQGSEERSAEPSGEQSGEPSENSESPPSGQGRGESDQTPPSESQESRGEGQPSEPPSGQGQQEPQNGSGGRAPDREPQARDLMRDLGANDEPSQAGNPNQGGYTGGDQRIVRPLTGDDFRDWSDRLRDVEEMVDDPELRAEASRIREQAREIRKELNRNSEEPNWDLIKMKVAEPLAELQDRVVEEILRRSSDEAMVPIDRDPVPVQYQDAVRKYYEQLGGGK